MNSPMNSTIRTCLRTGIAAALVIGGFITSCSASPEYAASDSSVQEAIVAESPGADQVSQNSADNGSQDTDVPQSLPQLVKRAELVIQVRTMDDAIEQVMAIARNAGGDLLRLQNQTPPNDTAQHTAYLELRVPQAQLDLAIDQLSELGTVDQQFLTAEDVSAQLVDFEARLRNLRKAEETVLEIMDRSGEIGDVLQVAQELRTIRQSIEQIDGQLASLRNRVSYSTIALTLEAEGAGTPSQNTVTTQLGNSWRGATRSVATFTVDLMQIGIWLLVYSPYWIVLGGLGYGVYRLVKNDRQSAS